MAWPEGNEYYKLRSKDGREKIFETPEQLGEACNRYFEWCVDNPLKEQVVFHANGMITKDDLNKMRVFSLEGLCNFIDIAYNTFMNYAKQEDFLIVTARVRSIIDNQQFEGAASGFLNPNIIARKLGLTDKQEHDHKGDIKFTGIQVK